MNASPIVMSQAIQEEIVTEISKQCRFDPGPIGLAELSVGGVPIAADPTLPPDIIEIRSSSRIWRFKLQHDRSVPRTGFGNL